MDDVLGDKKKTVSIQFPLILTHHYRTYTFKSQCGLKDCCRRKLVLFSGGSERKERGGKRRN